MNEVLRHGMVREDRAIMNSYAELKYIPRKTKAWWGSRSR